MEWFGSFQGHKVHLYSFFLSKRHQRLMVIPWCCSSCTNSSFGGLPAWCPMVHCTVLGSLAVSRPCVDGRQWESCCCEFFTITSFCMTRILFTWSSLYIEVLYCSACCFVDVLWEIIVQEMCVKWSVFEQLSVPQLTLSLQESTPGLHGFFLLTQDWSPVLNN